MNNLYFNFVLADNDVDEDGEAFTNDSLDEICKLCIGHSGLFDGFKTTARITDAVIMDSCGTTKDGRFKRFIYASAEIPNDEEGRNLISRIMNHKPIASIACSCKNRDTVCDGVTMISGITDFYEFSLRFEEDEDTTKDEIQTRLEAAEKQMIGLLDEINNLKAKLDEVQEEVIPEFPVFERGEDYWYLDIDGCIERNYASGVTKGNDFNMFHNDKYAKLYADKCREIAMLLHCKWYLCCDYNPDFNNGYIKKWTVIFNINEGKFTVDFSRMREWSTIYFDTEENAQKAADWMNAHAKRGTNDDEETT